MRVERGALAFALLLAVSGCGELKEDGPAPVVEKQPADAPASEDGTRPPYGKPRAKVPPGAVNPRGEMKAGESLTHPGTPPH